MRFFIAFFFHFFFQNLFLFYSTVQAINLRKKRQRSPSSDSSSSENDDDDKEDEGEMNEQFQDWEKGLFGQMKAVMREAAEKLPKVCFFFFHFFFHSFISFFLTLFFIRATAASARRLGD